MNNKKIEANTHKIPKSVSEITEEYLTEIFRENGNLTEGCIESLSYKEDKVGVNSNSGHFLLFFALWDYSYQRSDDPYWWYKFQNVNHAFMNLKFSEL